MGLTLTDREAALLTAGRLLRARGYRFITITPESHRRVNARPASSEARTIADVLGWSRPFAAGVLPRELDEALRAAGVIEDAGDGRAIARVRFSTLGDELYVHSAYPTTDEHSVFFGPDTYRFCAAVRRAVTSAKRVVDVGCGSGVGGLCLADKVEQIVLADINPHALSFARVNAHLGGVADRVELVQGDLFAEVRGDVDLVIANPPYVVDPKGRVYRDGGGELGTGLGVRIVREGLARLAPGGTLIVYTGAPVVDGEDRFRAAIAPVCERASRWSYEELDPDVFGEELETPGYAAVDRIAAVLACVVT